MPQNSSLFNGGIIGKDNTPSASDKVTSFTSNGCFNRTTASATVIVVAGGGSGGQGGGGAGGVLVTECHPLPASAVPVTIGAGGAARPSSSPYANPGTSGANSVFGSSTPLTATGGAGGGGNRGNGGGGAGGPCAATAPPGSSAWDAGKANEGFNSGAGGSFQQGGGGGGAGGKGGDTVMQGGIGGFGKVLLPYGVPKCLGQCGVFGGGGGGQATQFNDGDPAGDNFIPATPHAPELKFCTGGFGGGGQGEAKIACNSSTPFQNATNGTANTGGGGGAVNLGYSNGPQTTGAGGSGIVIVVEPSASVTVNSGVYKMNEQYHFKKLSKWS